MELQTLGADQLERVSRFIEPLFMETYGDKVTNGPEAARAIFDRWDTVEPLKRKHASGVRYFMHAEGGKDLGLIALKKEENGVLYLDKLYIAREAQGKGLGGRLMEFAFRYGRELGCDIIATHSNADNLRAVRFYEKHGMSVAAVVHRIHDGGEYDYAYLVGKIPPVQRTGRRGTLAAGAMASARRP